MDSRKIRRVVGAGLGGVILVWLALSALILAIVASWRFGLFMEGGADFNSPLSLLLIFGVIPLLLIGAGMLPALSLGASLRRSLIAGVIGCALAYLVSTIPRNFGLFDPVTGAASIIPVGVTVLAASLVPAEGRGQRIAAALAVWVICLGGVIFAGNLWEFPGISGRYAVIRGVGMLAILATWIAVPLAALLGPELWALAFEE